MSKQQTDLFPEAKPRSDEFDLHSYDRYLVFFSGGKDSWASLLHLIEMGVPRDRIELWHHLIDGKDEPFMDWPITEDYCRAAGDAMGIPTYFSWKDGGFRREMMRNNQPTAAMQFETPDGLQSSGGKSTKLGTRLKFPQISANLSVRWCSAYLKIDVASSAIRNQERFAHSRTLTLSGERAEESTARSKYSVFEPDRADRRHGASKRHVDRWRPVHGWLESDVWEILKRWRINPHPAYWLGWGRCSCMFCIFGSPDQWATGEAVNPKGYSNLVEHEEQFEFTLHREETIPQRAARGTAYPLDPGKVRLAMSTAFTEPMFLDEWDLPPGAFGDSCGPT